LTACGIRVTEQRLQVASLLLRAPQHLSAEQITEALRGAGTRVSKATIYNTLNLFAARGLIRQVSVDGSCAWFDSNVAPHYHFHDEQTGALLDVEPRDVQFSRLPQPPSGMEVAGIDVVIRLRRRTG
jgi:Fur family iron response transcriptional regulator